MKNTAREKILKQKAMYEFKNNNLILHSIKVTATKNYDDNVTITARELLQFKKIKLNDVVTLRKLAYKYARKDALKIDSESMKLRLCNHARARQHVFNQIAQAINRKDLVTDYTAMKKATQQKVKIARAKAKVKKVTIKK